MLLGMSKGAEPMCRWHKSVTVELEEVRNCLCNTICATSF